MAGGVATGDETATARSRTPPSGHPAARIGGLASRRAAPREACSPFGGSERVSVGVVI